MMIPALLLPPWLAPLAVAARAVLDTLAKLRITINGVALAGAVLAVACGGWWLARKVRADERHRIATERALGAKETVKDLGLLVAAKRGEIAADDDRLARISGELRALIAAIPPETITKDVPREVRTTVYLPAPIGETRPAPTPSAHDDYTPALRAKLNEINTRRP